MDLMQWIISAVTAVVIFSIAYRLLPHQTVPDQKPKFAVFPKYKFRISSPEGAYSTLDAMGFKRQNDSNVFVRGHYVGDFSASWARLNVVVDTENAYLHSPLIAIFFDTGDLWKIAIALSTPTAID